jgi:4-hydroxy-tetrahydrodipicolinate reductase
MTRVVIVGAGGRMGRTLIEACWHAPQISLLATTERADSALIGTDAGEIAGLGILKVPVEKGLEEIRDKIDVVIDFTQPLATLNHLSVCRTKDIRMVIGTTGFNVEQRSQIASAAQDLAIVLAPNMSIGVNLCLTLIEMAAHVLGDEADVEIIEAHHRHKVDAPSGTALRMGEVVANALGRKLEDCAQYGRQGHMGERDPKVIGFETIRAGDIVGDHTVMFAGMGERIEIVHRATSRMTFAKGAVRAASWIMQHERGMFDMRDVLGLKRFS